MDYIHTNGNILDIEFKEILLTEILNDILPNSNQSIRSALNQEIISLGYAGTNVDILMIDNIDLTLKFPDLFIDLTTPINSITPFVHVYGSNSEVNYYYDGNYINNPFSGDTIPLYINLGVSERNIAIDPLTLKNYRGIDLSLFFDEEVAVCTEVQTLLNSSPINSINSNFVWAELYDIQEKYLSCKLQKLGQNDPPLPPPPPPGGSCYRDQADQNNLYYSFRPFDYDDLNDYLGNQPCEEPEDDFAFKIATAFDFNGSSRVNAVTRNYKRNEISIPPKFTIKHKFHWPTLKYVPYLEKVQEGQPRWALIEYPYFVGISGGSTTGQNTWSLSHQGDLIGSAIHEFDVLTCDKKTSSQTSTTISFNFAGQKKDNLGGNVSYTVSAEYVYKAESVVECANLLMPYCEDFSGGNINDYDYGVLLVGVLCQLL